MRKPVFRFVAVAVATEFIPQVISIPVFRCNMVRYVGINRFDMKTIWR